MAATSQPRPGALVTGASQGLGASIALRLARSGFDVAVTARAVESLGVVVKDLQVLGARAVPLALDLRSQESMEQALADAARALPALELLVNNAAVTLRRPALEVTPDEWRELMDVNLTGTFFMSQQMARHLIRNDRRGSIVNLSSTHGMVALAQRSTYGISKAGIIHMTRVLAYEWAEHGVRVNAVAPGTVETPSRSAYFDAHPGSREMMLGRVPSGRFATMDEVAGAVAYLASADAANITGHTLMLDGGLTTY
jgi:NAD(P)-dependent dehydrogenase (short-subunit alcohol dehydrogenase family)